MEQSLPITEPVIRVGILTAPTIEFELKGNFMLNHETVAPGNYTITVNDIEDFPLAYQASTSASTFILKNVTIGIGFHWEQKENQEFEGGLTFQFEDGKVRAVNEIPLESYLKSVISSEMSAMNDGNLLNAHAIVSRSWLLAQVQNRSESRTAADCHASSNVTAHNNGTSNEIIHWYDREDHDTFDVCADDHCQRYQGITKVISDNARRAIEATRGQVLMYNGKICDARFSKCCGGITEDFENVWQPVKVQYLVAVKDFNTDRVDNPVGVTDDYFTTSPEAFCNTSDPEVLRQVLIDFDRSTTNFYRWTVEYTRQEISGLLAKKSGTDFGEIVDMVPLERGNSGRIIRLKIIGTKRTIIVGKELEIRKWLSESHLYSSAFMVEKVMDAGSSIPSKFILHGAGWGHGVGMCQIGAAVMSREGFTSAEILKHYFKGTKIEKIY
jgi:stage II sporulation protein D